jgi:hypothetical protein
MHGVLTTLNQIENAFESSRIAGKSEGSARDKTESG